MKIIRYLLFIFALIFFTFTLFNYIKKTHFTTEMNLNTDEVLTTAKISKTILDVGKQKLNIPVQANFVLYNVGNKDLYIQKVEPDCHCTVAEFSKSAISSGDSSTVVLKYDGKAPGTFQSSATITLNTTPSTVLLVFRGSMIE